MAIIDGLVAYWALNETGQGIGTPDTFFPALDAQGSNPLTDVGSCGSQPGKVGTSRLLSAGRYLSHPSNSVLQTGNVHFSFSLWFYSTATVRQHLISKEDNYPTADYTIAFYGQSPGVEQIEFYINSGNAELMSSVVGIPLNMWHHVAAGYNATTNELFLAVDGVLAVGSAYGEIPFATTAEFRLGSSAYDTTNHRNLVGRLDEVGFWKNKVLSPADIAWLYNGGAGRSYADLQAQAMTNDLFVWLL